MSEKAIEGIEVGGEYFGTVQDVALPAGHGVVRLGGLVVFVPGAVTGDTVHMKIVRVERRFAYGEVVAIEEASLLREAPRCAHFGACGGCDLQAMSYAAQLKLKENHLAQSLARIGGQDVSVIKVSPIVPSVEAYCYRGKIESVVRRGRRPACRRARRAVLAFEPIRRPDRTDWRLRPFQPHRCPVAASGDGSRS